MAMKLTKQDAAYYAAKIQALVNDARDRGYIVSLKDKIYIRDDVQTEVVDVYAKR